MRREMKWRYYCDYCKKSGGSGSAMAIHEKHCTMNPNRVCRFCATGADWGMEQHPIGDLIAALGCGDEAGMKALRELAQDCPACMLAAIRQSGLWERLCSADCDEDGCLPSGYGSCFCGFDFKKEAAEFWAEVNSHQREWDNIGYMDSGCYY